MLSAEVYPERESLLSSTLALLLLPLESVVATIAEILDLEYTRRMRVHSQVCTVRGRCAHSISCADSARERTANSLCVRIYLDGLRGYFVFVIAANTFSC